MNTITKYRPLLKRVFVSLYITAIVLLVTLTVILSLPDPVDNRDLLSATGIHTEMTTGQSDTENGAVSLDPSEPVLLRIPSIGLVASFEEPLGLNADGTVKVPESFDKVGRYEHTPTPGEIGPAVILGHVDSFRGPAVFYSLGEVLIGDMIAVERNDGKIAIFEVSDIDFVKQDDFPGAKVYGTVDHSAIRLVTCSGDFNRDTNRYTHNLIVYGKLKRVDVPFDSIK